MPPEQHQNINFLPHELEEKRRLVKEEIGQAVSYTEPEPALNFLQRKKLPPLAAAAAPSLPAAEAKESELAAQASEKKEESKAAPAERRPGLFTRLFGRKPKLAASAPRAAPAPGNAPGGKDLSGGALRRDNAAAAAEEEILNVNLLSQEYAQAFVLKNQVVVYCWALAVSLLAVAVGFAGAKLYETREQSRLAQERGRNQALSEVIVSYRDLAVADGLLKRKVQALRALLKKHISFKTFLEQLESATIAEVSYQNIAVTGKGGVNLAARATDYTAAARQLSVFQTKAPWVKTVVMTGARVVPGAESKSGGVGFDLALSVDESVFILKE